MVASRGGSRMARGRHYAKLSLSNAARLSFSDLCILLFMFLSLCRLFVCVCLCSHWSLVDVPLIFFCPADHVPDWQPRVLLCMVEARSVNVKKTTQQPHNKKFSSSRKVTRRQVMRRTLQAMAPTNVKTVHQTSLLNVESNLDRLGLLSPTHGQRSQQQSGKSHSSQF